jgi:hypothetical protein
MEVNVRVESNVGFMVISRPKIAWNAWYVSMWTNSRQSPGIHPIITRKSPGWSVPPGFHPGDFRVITRESPGFHPGDWRNMTLIPMLVSHFDTADEAATSWHLCVRKWPRKECHIMTQGVIMWHCSHFVTPPPGFHPIFTRFSPGWLSIFTCHKLTSDVSDVDIYVNIWHVRMSHSDIIHPVFTRVMVMFWHGNVVTMWQGCHILTPKSTSDPEMSTSDIKEMLTSDTQSQLLTSKCQHLTWKCQHLTWPVNIWHFHPVFTRFSPGWFPGGVGGVRSWHLQPGNHPGYVLLRAKRAPL